MRDTVLRHTPLVRTTHWVIAISGIMLLFSGFGEMPMYKRYMLTELPGMAWTSDFALQTVIHYIAAFFFTAALFFHMVYHTMNNEFSIIPRKGDMKESWDIIKAMITGKEEPPSGKFLAEQRVAYAAIGTVSLVLVFTGLIKVYKNTGAIVLDAAMLKYVTLLHTASTMIFMLLIIAHLAAFIIKANRPLVPSMFTGRIDKQYAEHRHSKWETKTSE